MFKPLIKNLSQRLASITRTGVGLAALALGLAALALGLLYTNNRAIEEPAYTVTRTLNGVELRDYAAYTVAEVQIETDEDDAGKRAFPILAGYIFGKNKGEQKMAMTAPVTQTATPIEMAMTVPVTQTPSGAGFLVQFVLPKDITLANAPEPLDPRVMLREVAPKRVAVIRYSGFWSASNYQKHLALLQSELNKADIKWTGEPVFSRYNDPFMPWFLRRNEIWLNLAP